MTEIWFILKRNRRIKIRGRDNFFTIAVVLLLGLVCISAKEGLADIPGNTRNSLIVVILLSSAAIKIGISEKGMVKFIFTIPWQKIDDVFIVPHQNTTILMIGKVGMLIIKLIFPKEVLGELVYELQRHCGKVYLHELLKGDGYEQN